MIDNPTIDNPTIDNPTIDKTTISMTDLEIDANMRFACFILIGSPFNVSSLVSAFFFL